MKKMEGRTGTGEKRKALDNNQHALQSEKVRETKREE